MICKLKLRSKKNQFSFVYNILCGYRANFSLQLIGVSYIYISDKRFMQSLPKTVCTKIIIAEMPTFGNYWSVHPIPALRRIAYSMYMYKKIFK